jgi:16S rRNA pseudouridine516 synthase
VLNFIDVDKAFDLHIAGRLDADTTGLVLITDDGRWSHNVISPKKECPKTYRVWLKKPINDEEESTLIAHFKEGIQLQGEASLTRPAKLVIIGPDEALLTITEGKYHQVKRMFAAVGNKVVDLHREQIGKLELGNLAEGEWRYLLQEEVAYFLE